MGGVEDLPLDDNLGFKLLDVMVPLYTIALVVYGIRMYNHIFPKYRLNRSDYTMTAAMVSESLTTHYPESGSISLAVGRMFILDQQLIDHDYYHIGIHL
jgi:hypothetical protein